MDKEVVTCKICKKLICRPISTHCGHSYCLWCLQEVMRKCIGIKPRCFACNENISGAYEVNKLAESILQQAFPEEYNQRLNEPAIEIEISKYYLWKVSILKTIGTVSIIILPVLTTGLLFKYATKFPRIFFKLIKVAMKIGTYKSTSFVWQIVWTIMHMIVKYLEATSVLSNITN